MRIGEEGGDRLVVGQAARDVGERRRVGVGRMLIRRDDMAGRAPTLGDRAAMRRVGAQRGRAKAADNRRDHGE